jgi:hypothetical protein
MHRVRNPRSAPDIREQLCLEHYLIAKPHANVGRHSRGYNPTWYMIHMLSRQLERGGALRMQLEEARLANWTYARSKSAFICELASLTKLVFVLQRQANVLSISGAGTKTSTIRAIC